MTEEVVLPNKPIAAYNTQKNNDANAPFAVRGVVKDNVDATRSGTIRVYVEQFGSNPDDDKSWTTIHYISPFYGRTEPTAPSAGYGSFTGNPHSYGFWATAPDIGTEVLCIFADGKKDFGFYLGSIIEPNQNFMIPAIASSKDVVPTAEEAKSYGGATSLPVTEINVNNKGDDNSPSANKISRPIHSYQAAILFQQGLLRDSVRGTISSSAVRETPSRVFGLSTPGRPIYKGGYSDSAAAGKVNTSEPGKQIIGRRGGHSIVLDDGDIEGENQLVRIRTAQGHQITMSDDGQTLFIIHSNGQSYIELGKEGTVDIFSTNSFNVRTQGDINFHADNNININAKKNLNLFGENVNIESEKDTLQRSGGAYSASSKDNYTVRSDSGMSLLSSGEMGIKSSGSATYINGTKINLNTGSPSITPATVTPITKIVHTDTLFDKEKGWLAAPGKLVTVTSRAPAHTPWANANQGVDVKVSGDAADNLPNPTTSEAAAAATSSAGSAPELAVTPAAIATVPIPSAVGGNIDVNATAAAISQTAATMATGAAAAAVQAGAGIVESATGSLTAAVGSLAMSPTQLASAGIIKPGAENLINSAIASGKSIAEAIPKQLFTGKDGINDLTSFVKNTTAQVGAQVTLMQQGMTGLISSGVISGSESSTAITGLVSAAATAGTSAVTDFAKNAAGSIGSLTGGLTSAAGSLTGGLTGALSNPLASVQNLIAGGNFASGLAQKAMSGLGSLSGSIGAGLGGLGDIATNAFNTIKESLPSLPSGKPVNLAEKAAAAAEAAEGSTDTATPDTNLSSGLSGLAGAASSAMSAVSSATGSITSTLNKALSAGEGAISGAVSSLTNAATSTLSGVVSGAPNSLLSSALASATTVVKSAQTLVSSAASGITNLTGGSSAVSNIVNSGTAAVNSIPGINNLVSGTSISGQINNALGSITGGLSNLTTNPASAVNGLVGLASSGLGSKNAAQLASLINSLGGSGPQQIKAPTVALNTMNRGSINSSMTGLVGKGVNPPNFSGSVKPPEAAQEKELTSLQGQITTLEQQIKESKESYNKSYAELLELTATIKAVSQEEYEAQGLGPKFKEKKAECYNILNAQTDLIRKKSELSDKIVKAKYG